MIQMKLAVLAFYGDYDIHEAKEELLTAVDGVIECEKPARQNSVTRSAKEAELDDILDIFKDLDQLEEGHDLRFHVEDITKLPPAGPEAGGSVMSLLESMSRMQRSLQQLEQSVGEVRADVTRQNHDVEKIKEDCKRITSRSYASTVSDRPPKHPVGSINVHLRQKAQNDDKNIDVHSSDMTVDKAPREGETSETNEELAFTTVEKRKKGDRRQRGTAGTAVTTGRMMAGPEMFNVQITNVHPSIGEEEIRHYIAEKDSTIDIKEIKDTSSEGWETKRFLLKFDSKVMDTILKDDFWPARVYYRRWYVNRPSKQQGDGAGKFINS